MVVARFRPATAPAIFLPIGRGGTGRREGSGVFNVRLSRLKARAAIFGEGKQIYSWLNYNL